MRIGILISIPGFNWTNPNSAVVNYLRTVGDFLIKNGFEVDYFPVTLATSQENNTSSSAKLKGVKSFIKKLAPEIITKLKFKKYFAQQEQLYIDHKAAFEKCDLIIEFLTYGSDLGAQIKKKLGKKLIVIFDSPLHTQFQEMHKVKHAFKKFITDKERSSLITSDAVICYSDPVKTFLINEIKIATKIKVIPCLVWKDGIDPIKDAFQYVGFIGSFLNWHKVENLLIAFEKIASKHQNLKLVLIGKGEEWSSIAKMVENSTIKDRILLTGFLSEVELNEWKSKITIGVMPGSNWYGSPLKIFEYMESKIPVIAPDTPAVRYLFEDQKEVLFIDKNREIDSLAELISELLLNTEKRELLIRNCEINMKTKFAKENVLRNFVELINTYKN